MEFANSDSASAKMASQAKTAQWNLASMNAQGMENAIQGIVNVILDTKALIVQREFVWMNVQATAPVMKISIVYVTKATQVETVPSKGV